MNIVRKDAALTPTGSDEDFPGTFEVILSAPTLDRDGDTLTPDGWKQPLPDRITFDSDHGMSVASTVGSGIPTIDKATGNLLVKGEFSSLPRAQEVRTLVKEGHINTTSVAFMNIKSTKDGVTSSMRELLNGAFVAIPSNREALVLSSKAGARNSAADQARVQAIHDGAVGMGADCPGMGKAFRAPGAKAVAGSLEAVRERVLDALEDANPEVYCGLLATIPDGNGGGTVVYCIGNDEWQQTYTDDGSVVTLTGSPAAVDIQETVVADPDPERDAPATGAAAEPNAGDPTQVRSPAEGTAVIPTEQDDLDMKRARLLATLAIVTTN